MSFINGVWSSLVFSADDALGTMASNMNWRMDWAGKGDLIYKPNLAYKNVFVHVARQMAMSKLEQEIKSILPKFMKKTEDKFVAAARREQQANFIQLIKNQETQVKDYGKIQINDNKDFVVAKDKYGNTVPEALILSYKMKEGNYDAEDFEVSAAYNVTDRTQNIDGDMMKRNGGVVLNQVKRQLKANVHFHIDLSPEININSQKNVVMTQVTGRDYSRKELVSGGDIKISVSGSIVEDQEGVYPESKVKQFMSIMQYGGIIDISHFMLGNINVKQVIITDFSLGKQEYKNVQPYSFSCVSVEPDDEIKVVKDTIGVINQNIEASPMSGWYKAILTNKWAQIASNAAVNATNKTATQVVSMSMDVLTEAL